MKYFDLLNLKSKYTQVLQQIVTMEEQDTKNIYLSECAQNVSKLFASYYFDKKQLLLYILHHQFMKPLELMKYY